MAFRSFARNLSDEDRDRIRDVFVRDLVTNRTVLVSRADGRAGQAGDGSTFSPVISADGRYVAFDSSADNLSDEDRNGTFDIFVRDLVANRTVLASRQTGVAGRAANKKSYVPTISANGRFVAFESEATNLSDADRDDSEDVFVRDLVAGTTVLASRASGARGRDGNDESSYPSLSDDGRFVAFDSRATNLSDADKAAFEDVFVRDLRRRRTILVSRRGRRGPGGDGHSSYPAISGDGRFVAFDSRADNLSSADRAGTIDVFVRDLRTGRTTLVSRRGKRGPAGDGHSSSASISSDGRFVVFNSRANNLSGVDRERAADVFLRDMRTGELTLLTRGSSRERPVRDHDALEPAISPEGCFVTFQSDASDLRDDDRARVEDVFVQRLECAEAAAERRTPPAAIGGRRQRTIGEASCADRARRGRLSNEKPRSMRGFSPFPARRFVRVPGSGSRRSG